MKLTAKQYLTEKSYLNSVFVIKGKTSGMFIDINGIFERDVEQAHAFANYDDAMDYIKGSQYPSLLEPVRYKPTAEDDDTEEQDLISDLSEEEIRADRNIEDNYPNWREQTAGILGNVGSPYC